MDCIESSGLTHAILSSAGIGLWTIELDEGKPPRMYADKALLQIFGFPDEILPEDLYNYGVITLTSRITNHLPNLSI